MLAAGLVLAATAVAWSAAAARAQEGCTGSSCNGQNSNTAGCVSDAVSRSAPATFSDPAAGGRLAIQLRGSPSCESRWARAWAYNGSGVQSLPPSGLQFTIYSDNATGQVIYSQTATVGSRGWESSPYWVGPMVSGVGLDSRACFSNGVCTSWWPSPPSSPSGSCQNWYVLGLHGIEEGPGYAGDKNESRELSYFAADLKKDGPMYGYATEEPVPYPTLAANWKDAEGTFNQGPLWANVTTGVADLQAMVKHYRSTCPGSLMSLFGYSEGAWIINVWELKYPAEASHIYSAGLIGDPCYTDVLGDKGLARLFTDDCGPADDYIVGETNIQPTNSDCLTLDPVCGLGYLGSGAAQLTAAGICSEARSACAHQRYVPGEVADMASWMLSDTT
jgi:hypothetical protein